MSLDYKYNSLKVEATGRSTYVPDNDLAKLMYYLYCVLEVIQYDENTKLTDYQNYYRLTQQEEKSVYALAALFQPKILIDAGVLIPDERLVPPNLSAEFYKITDDRIGIHVNREIAIGGRVVRVLNVLAFTMGWLNKNYIYPLERVSKKLESQNTYNVNPPSENKCCGKCTCKKCFCWFCFLAILILFFYVYKHS